MKTLTGFNGFAGQGKYAPVQSEEEFRADLHEALTHLAINLRHTLDVREHQIFNWVPQEIWPQWARIGPAFTGTLALPSSTC
jgi:hypothetical protein